MKKIETWFDKTGSSLKWENLKEYKTLISELPEGRYIVTIEKVENIRSREQNNALWAIPYKFFESALIFAGIFKDPSKHDIHNWCMVNCLPSDYKQRILDEWMKVEPIINLKTYESYKEPFRLTTTKMKTTDAVHYYENMQLLYAETFSTGEEGDFIPDPEKGYKNKKAE
jgi:hypothetical protein